MLGVNVNGPDFAGGGFGFGVAGAVETDEADDFFAGFGGAHGDPDLWLAVLNRVAPEGLAFFGGEIVQMLISHDASVGDLPGADVDGGDGGDIAQGGGADGDVLHDFVLSKVEKLVKGMVKSFVENFVIRMMYRYDNTHSKPT